ncbi:MAG: transglutaminase-like domain-containing protein, partial [Planctomycetota bacterium]|nr:transglutaminase-like domain-containing protein [Planctomycetota bacterium]
YARAGVGDGDQLTNGEDATSVGAVETDQFIEDDKPSLYDIMSESFDSPKMKPKQQRSKAVSPDAIAKHLHEIKQSEQAGKTFRTHRESSTRGQRKLEDRIAKALFYVEGPVPTRFAVDYYSCFDGWDWSKVELSESDLHLPEIQLEFHQSNPWYTLALPQTKFLTGELHHKVKVMRLEALSLPSPPFLKAWHIPQVDHDSFFQWNQDGAIGIDGVQIPSQTIINTISRIPNFSALNSASNPVSADAIQWDSILGGVLGGGNGSPFRYTGSPDSPFLRLADNGTKGKIQDLADQWTAGLPWGWEQVQAIVTNIRTGYRVDNQWIIDETTENTVGSFLEQGGGPTYMFATTAVQVLRAAGYPARLASGFVVRKEDFVPKANQSIVTSENFHFWPEVRLENYHWVPVEPTPGYPVPVSYQSLWTKLTSSVSMAARWVVRNPLASLLVLASVALLIRVRKSLLSFFFWILWCSLFFLSCRYRLLVTRRLLDIRLWAAGFPRPRFATIANWCSQIGDNENRDFFLYWNQEQFSTAANFNVDRRQVEESCRKIVAEFSLKRIKSFVKQNN